MPAVLYLTIFLSIILLIGLFWFLNQGKNARVNSLENFLGLPKDESIEEYYLTSYINRLWGYSDKSRWMILISVFFLLVEIFFFLTQFLEFNTRLYWYTEATHWYYIGGFVFFLATIAMLGFSIYLSGISRELTSLQDSFNSPGIIEKYRQLSSEQKENLSLYIIDKDESAASVLQAVIALLSLNVTLIFVWLAGWLITVN